MYDYTQKKTVVVISATASNGVAANVIAHLCFSIGKRVDINDFGQNPLIDGDGISHTGISKYPIIVTKLKSSKLKKVIAEFKSIPDILIADYPTEMLETGHDNELVEALKSKSNEELEYLGCAVFGDSAVINNLTAKFTLWR